MKRLFRFFWPDRSRNYPTLPTVKADPGRPVPVNPPLRRDFPDNDQWLAAIHDHQMKLAEYHRDRNLATGITRFRWVWAKAGPTPCSVGQKYDGKIFDYNAPPPEGLPGAARCDHDYCRYCFAKAIIPGFEG